jgi:hypothetical protein
MLFACSCAATRGPSIRSASAPRTTLPSEEPAQSQIRVRVDQSDSSSPCALHGRSLHYGSRVVPEILREGETPLATICTDNSAVVLTQDHAYNVLFPEQRGQLSQFHSIALSPALPTSHAAFAATQTTLYVLESHVPEPHVPSRRLTRISAIPITAPPIFPAISCALPTLLVDAATTLAFLQSSNQNQRPPSNGFLIAAPLPQTSAQPNPTFNAMVGSFGSSCFTFSRGAIVLSLPKNSAFFTRPEISPRTPAIFFGTRTGDSVRFSFSPDGRTIQASLFEAQDLLVHGVSP